MIQNGNLSGIAHNSGKIPLNVRRKVTDFGEMLAKPFRNPPESIPKEVCEIVRKSCNFGGWSGDALKRRFAWFPHWSPKVQESVNRKK